MGLKILLEKKYKGLDYYSVFTLNQTNVFTLLLTTRKKLQKQLSSRELSQEQKTDVNKWVR
ncbi:hypothetical protein D9O36_16550 [Zobellia amurskyensis]|uniref:Uncharacterized protein n=1 Tax=Zobellia amurskyensis TaxID=248905 RepID=A0A7X2ZW37_9FLAO|nr:hypothetical protein [Zobellia amurskyensis]